MHDHLPIKYWGDYNSARASFVFRFFSFVSSLFSFALSLSLSLEWPSLEQPPSPSPSPSPSLPLPPPLSLNRFFRWKTTDDTLSFFACFPETTYVHCSVLPWELGEAGVIFSTVSPFHRSSISSIPPSVLSSQIGLGSLGVARPDALACGDFHLWCSSWVVSALRLCTLFFCLFNLISVVALILMISYQWPIGVLATSCNFIDFTCALWSFANWNCCWRSPRRYKYIFFFFSFSFFLELTLLQLSLWTQLFEQEPGMVIENPSSLIQPSTFSFSPTKMGSLLRYLILTPVTISMPKTSLSLSTSQIFDTRTWNREGECAKKKNFVPIKAWWMIWLLLLRILRWLYLLLLFRFEIIYFGVFFGWC